MEHWEQSSQGLREDLDQILTELDAKIEQGRYPIFYLAVKCRLIGEFTYLEDFYWEDTYELLEECEAQLFASDETHPEVLLYRIENEGADEAVTLGDELLESGLMGWSDEEIAEFYRRLSFQHRWADMGTPGAVAISALAYDVTDPEIILLAAEEYILEGDPYLAASTLNRLGLDSSCWILSEAAELAATELKDIDTARRMLTAADDQDCRDQSYNWVALAAVHELTGEHEQADAALREAVQDHWRADQLLRDWFERALEMSPPQRAKAAYELMRDQGYQSDPVLYHRIRLFWAHPELGWKMRDLAGVLTLVGILALSIVLPLLLLIPIHWRGMLRQRSGRTHRFEPSRWRLWHAWVALSSLLALDLFLSLAFLYDETMALVLDEPGIPLEPGESSFTYAMLILVGAQCVIAMLLLRPGLSTLTPGRWSIGKCIGAGLGLMIVLKLIAALNMYWFGDLPDFGAAPFTEGLVIDILQRFGALGAILLVGLAIPIFEEILIRGVLLASIAKHISFGWANLIQASLFWILHEDVAMFMFYLAFGLIAGELFRRSHSLLPGIALHVFNNMLAVAILISLGI